MSRRPRAGWRFLPSDEEIVSHFLKQKMDGNDDLVDEDVHEIDLCKNEPWDLPSLCANEESHDQTWYFFCKRERNKTRQIRKTEAGYWKSTGQDRRIKNKTGKKVIGTKKTLRFYKGRTPHEELTEWTIHEYNSSCVLPHQTHFVLCKLMKTNSGKADALACNEDEPLGNRPSNNANDLSGILTEVDQVRSVSFDVGNSFHQLKMQKLGQTAAEISSFNNDFLNEPARLGSSSPFSMDELLKWEDEQLNWEDLLKNPTLGSSSAFSEDELKLADSFLNESAAPEMQLIEAKRPSNVQFVNESARRSGTLPTLKHDDNGMKKIVHIRGRAEMDNISEVINRVSTESSSGSTTPGDFEIYANGQEFSESSSTSPNTAEQEIYLKEHEWRDSRGWYRSACGSQSQRRLSNKSDSKIQKPTAVHLSQKKSSDDSGKIKRPVVESENDQKMVVAAAISKLRSFMNYLIRFVVLVLFVVIIREMLISH